jgi:hypothetical protein
MARFQDRKERTKQIRSLLREKALQQRQKVWEEYRATKRLPTILDQPWKEKKSWIYKKLTKPQCSILVQIRSGAIGVASFLYKQRVPNISPNCSCREERIQTIRHVLLECPNYYNNGRSYKTLQKPPP